jgi:hypothetical protein
MPYPKNYSSMLRTVVAIAFFLWTAGEIRAQRLRHGGVDPQIDEAGRWHVQTTSGDQPAQVATGKPVTFDAWFECNGTACGGVQIYAHDSTICDPIGFENMSSGFVIDGTTGAFQFGVSGGFGDFFIYTFEGTLSETHTVTNGVTSLASATIGGSYGSTPGGCNDGLVLDQGTFLATWYPAMSGTFYGIVVPANVTVPPFGVELALTQSANGTLTGTATTGRLLRLRYGQIFEPIQSACFTSTTLAVTQQIGTKITGASGNLFQFSAVDGVGNSLSLEGVALEIGSNQAYTVQSGILGGVCHGASASLSIFRLLAPPRGVNLDDRCNQPQPKNVSPIYPDRHPC